MQKSKDSLAGRPVFHLLVRQLRSPNVEVGEPPAGRGASEVVVALVVGAHPEEDLGQDVGRDVQIDQVRVHFSPVAALEELSVLKMTPFDTFSHPKESEFKLPA